MFDKMFLGRSKEWIDPDVVATSLRRLEVEHGS